MNLRYLIAALAAFLPWLLAAEPVLGQGIERIMDSRDWSAFQYQENGDSVCYVASAPKQAEGDYTDRGDVFAIVTHRPVSKRIDEFSINAGYTYKPDSSVQIKIGSRNWNLFTEGGNAWAPTSEEDRELIRAMKAGSSMVVKGTSARGTVTTDTYSLLGFSKAYAAIGKACGL